MRTNKDRVKNIAQLSSIVGIFFSFIADAATLAFDLNFLAPFAAAAAGALLVRLGMRQLIGPIESPAGWAAVRPSTMHWGGVVGAGGIIGMLAYVGLFIGSERVDAKFQMQMLWLIVAGFATCGVGCCW